MITPIDKIILSGYANSKTSLGEVFRRYVDCFKTFSNPDIFDLEMSKPDNSTYYPYHTSYKGKIDHNIRYFHSTFHLYKELLAKAIPRCKCCNSQEIKKIGYFVWESSELKEEHSEILEEFDEIWTASNYCKTIFSQYIDSDKIKIIEHPIPFLLTIPEKFADFTILIIGNLSSNISRKNTINSLLVASAAKQKYQDIKIIFKTLAIDENEKTLLKTISQDFPVEIIESYYSTLETQELIAKSHIILSLHRSEGFGLCLAEGIFSDTIPLATGYSGNTDFMTDSRLLVDYKLVDTNVDYFPGQWAEPNYSDAKDKLFDLIENYETNTYSFSDMKKYSYSAVSETIKSSL
jgi:hypothetical protein